MKPSQSFASLVGAIAAAVGKPRQCHMDQRMPAGTNQAHRLTASASTMIHPEFTCLQVYRLLASFALAYE
jgi:hypothetical protein